MAGVVHSFIEPTAAERIATSIPLVVKVQILGHAFVDVAAAAGSSSRDSLMTHLTNLEVLAGAWLRHLQSGAEPD